MAGDRPLWANKALHSTPLLVYTAKDLTRKEELRLGRSTKSIVVKEVRSPERLREEVAAILDKGAMAPTTDSKVPAT